MSDFLWQTYHRLIKELEPVVPRFLYKQIDAKQRLLGIIGPRGVGKTTLLLQYIKENLYQDNSVFYFSADNIYFNQTSILAFVDHLYQHENIHTVVIDEIHKYPNWNQELKNIYDAFPKIQIIFSGSSSIDLISGAYDLSRRAKLLYLPGLSFREYLNSKLDMNLKSIDFNDLIENHQKIAADLSHINTINKHFEEYLAFGYYPIVFQGRDSLYEKLMQVIEKTIYEDIANFYNLKTSNLKHFGRILNFTASIPPGNVKINNLAQKLGIDNKTVEHYLQILTKTGLLKTLDAAAHGSRLLSKPAKIYLDNTTLLSACNALLSQPLDVGSQRELAFLQFVRGANLPVFYPKLTDFQINDIVFEVGGKNKKSQQLKEYTGQKFLVKDGILVGRNNEIPLYLFGFLY